MPGMSPPSTARESAKQARPLRVQTGLRTAVGRLFGTSRGCSPWHPRRDLQMSLPSKVTKPTRCDDAPLNTRSTPFPSLANKNRPDLGSCEGHSHKAWRGAATGRQLAAHAILKIRTRKLRPTPIPSTWTEKRGRPGGKKEKRKNRQQTKKDRKGLLRGGNEDHSGIQRPQGCAENDRRHGAEGTQAREWRCWG